MFNSGVGRFKLVGSTEGRMIEQLQQLCTVTWDGNLMSKSDRDALNRVGLIKRIPGGFNVITAKGVVYLNELGLLPKQVKL